jgi:hypothetical protein
MALTGKIRYSSGMTVTLSDELRQALDQSAGQPLRVEDPRTRKTYLLVEWDLVRSWIEPRADDGNWSQEQNARRCDLIRKKYAHGLTASETAELDQLQEQVGQFRERFEPLAAETVRALAAELFRITQLQSGKGTSS